MLSRMAGVIVILLFTTACQTFQPQSKVVECTSIKTPLPYLIYGVKTPKNDDRWKCLASRDLDFVNWESDGKSIGFSEGDTPMFPGALDASENPEPIATLRIYAEAFLGDQEVLDKNKTINELNSTYKSNITAMFFSKDRDRIAVYLDNGLSDYRGNLVPLHNAFIFNRDNNKKMLKVECRGCTFGEFFAYVIDPALQYEDNTGVGTTCSE